MRLDYYGTIKYVRVMASNNGMNVVFHEENILPHTDGDSIHVQQPDVFWSEDKWTVWFYTVLHEIGHETPNRRNWKDIIKREEIHPESFLGYVRNLMSDYGQERDQYGVYRGRDEYLSKGRALWVGGQIDKTEPSEDDHRDAAIALYIWDTEHRESWMPDLIGYGDRGERALVGKQLEYLRKLRESDLDPNDLVNEEVTLDFSKEVLKIMDFDPEKEEEEAKEMYKKAQQGEGEGEGKDGEGKMEGEGDEEGDGEGKEGKSKKKKVEVRYDDLLSHNHDFSKKTYDGMTDIHIKYDKLDHGRSYQPKKVTINDFTTNNIDPRFRSLMSTPNSNYKRDLRELHVSHGLASKTKRLLQVLSQSRWQHAQKRGKLSSRSLYKVNRKINATNVFKRKDQNMMLDTAVTVLTDFSGSMSYEKIVHAMRATSMLNDSIGKINVPLEILGFTEDTVGPVHGIFKKFNDKVSSDTLEDRMLRSSNHLYQNADGESIQWAFERLIKQKQKRKILIVLSDGSPASCNYGDITHYTKRVIEVIEEKTPVEIYGLGIMDRNVEHFYKNHSSIRNAGQLEDALIKVIRDKIIGIK